MQWYKHDANATTDDKLRKIILRHGAEGYAIFFHCIELITGDITKENVTFELKHDAEIIADNLKIRGTAEEAAIDKVNRIMKDLIDLGLFTQIDDRIFCLKLAKRLDNSIIKSPQLQEIKKTMKDNSNLPVVVKDCPGQSGLDKIREDKKRIDKKRVFKAPTREDVKNYISEKEYVINPDTFFDFYNENDWHDGNNNKVKNWKGKVVTWNSRELKNNPNAIPFKFPKIAPSKKKQTLLSVLSKMEADLIMETNTSKDMDYSEEIRKSSIERVNNLTEAIAGIKKDLEGME
jgi:hypothetical protein